MNLSKHLKILSFLLSFKIHLLLVINMGLFLYFIFRITNGHLDINMRFRTTALTGLILWTGRSDRSADFLALGLQDGRIEVTYDLGSGETVLRYNTTGLPINDGHWHRMKFTRFVEMFLNT